METEPHAEPWSTEAKLRAWRAPTIVGAIALAAYVRVFDYGFSQLDDKKLILEDQAFLTRPASVFESFGRLYFGGKTDGYAYYRPLITASLALDAHWTGANPFGYHFTNVLLHVVACVLVYTLLRSLRFSEWVAGVAATMFAVHPALVTAVAWIPGRNDSIFTVCTLGALLYLQRALVRPSPLHLGLHLGCFVAALFSKETAIVLPIIFTALVWTVRDETSSAASTPRAPSVKRLWAHWIPPTLLYLGIREWLVPPQPIAPADRLQILMHKLAVVPSSIGKLFLPLHLAVLPTASDAREWREVIPGILAVGLVIALLRFDRARTRYVVLASCLLLIPLLPSLITMDQLILENRLYLPAVGFSLVFAESLQLMAPTMAWTRVAAAALALIGFAATYTYEGALRDRGTFARAAVEKSPNLALAHLQMGTYYQQELNDLDAAEKEYRRAIELNPTEYLIHNNLGVLLMKRGQWSEAKAEFRVELRYYPACDKAHYNLGLVLAREGTMQDAVAEWRQVLVYNPHHIDAMGELMTYYMRRGQQAEATYYANLLKAEGLQLVSPTGKALDNPK